MPSKIFQPGLLDGQVAIVSGGGSGLGRAAALELAALGAQVVVCGRRLEPLEETAGAAEDGRVEAQACDIREEDQVEALVDGVLERHGQIDLLVNNAGGQYLTPAEDITPKGFRTVIRLNVEGTWLMTHAVATRAMIPDSRGGKIVNVTLSPHHGLPGMAHSSAARAAVENLTRVLSIEWARFGIRLTAVAPGTIATETMMTKYPKQVVEGVGGHGAARADGHRGGVRLARGLRRVARRRLSRAHPHPGRRARQLVRPVAAGRARERGGQAALRGEATEGVSEVPELRTERLLMRGWRFEDYAPLAEILADPAVGAGLGKPNGLTPHEAWLDMSVMSAHWSLRGFGNWALRIAKAASSRAAPGSTTRPTGPRSKSDGRWRGSTGERAMRPSRAGRLRVGHDQLGHATSSA